MANDGTVNVIIQQQAIENVNATKTALTTVLETIRSINKESRESNIKTNGGNTPITAEQINKTNEASRQKLKLANQQILLDKKVLQSKINLTNAGTKEHAQIIKNRLELSKKNKTLKDAEKLSTSLSKAYIELVNKMNRVGVVVQNLTAKKLQGIKLSKAEQVELKKTSTEFNKLQKAVLGADDAIGRHQRSVGNYKIATNDTNKILLDKMNKQVTVIQVLNNKKREGIQLSKKEKAQLKEAINGFRILEKSVLSVDKSLKTVDKSVKTANKSVNKFSKQQQAQFKRLQKSVQSADRSIKGFGFSMNKAVGAARSLASAMGLMAGAFLVVRVIRDAVNTLKNFEKQNATLSAILQIGKKDMTELTDDSQRLGEVTAKSAGEVVSLQIAYARLGFTQKEIINLTEATINGSISLNAELDETAELGGAMVNTFSEFSSLDMPEIMDIMALSTAKSALTFEKLQKGLPIVAGAANAAGYSFTRLVSLMGKLADAGIDTSMSSTAIRNIFIEASSKGLKYSEILELIKKSQNKLTTSTDEFGKRAAVSASVLADNIDQTIAFDEVLQKAGGTAQRMAEKELDTMSGALDLLQSKWKGIIIGVGETNDITNKLKISIQFLTKNLRQILNTLGVLIGVFITYKAIVIAVGLSQKIGIVFNTAYRLSVIALNRGLLTVIKSLKGFRVALANSGVGIALIAISYLILKLTKLNKSISETAQNTKDTNDKFREQAKESIKLNNELNTMADRYEVLKNKTKLTTAEQKELDEIIKKLAKEVPNVTSAFNNYGVAIGINIEKLREFTKVTNFAFLQKAELSIESQTESLEKLKKTQEEINTINVDGTTLYIKGIGEVVKRNEKLFQVNRAIGTYGQKSIKTYTELNSKKLDIYIAYVTENKKAIELTKSDIIENENLISTITGVKTARQKENEEKQKTKIIDDLLNTDKTLKRIDLEKKSIEELTSMFGKYKNNLEDINNLLPNTISAFQKLISETKALRDATAESKDEYDSFTKKIQEAENSIYKLKNGFTKLNPLVLGISIPTSQEAKKRVDPLTFDEKYGTKKKKRKYEPLDPSKRATVDLSEKTTEEKEIEKIKFELAKQSADALFNLGNAIFESKISKIDEEILAEENKYARLMELAEGDQEMQKTLALQKEQSLKILEDKKKKEQIKQAKFERAKAIIDIGVNTAVAITEVIPNPFLIALVASLGAIKLATVISAPLPKFKEGGIMKDDGFAFVGDGGQKEVVKTPDGKLGITPNKETLVNLPKGTEIFKNIETFNEQNQLGISDKIYSASLMASLSINNKRIQGMKASQKEFDKKLLQAMLNNTKAIKNQNLSVINNNQHIDLAHDLYVLNMLS